MNVKTFISNKAGHKFAKIVHRTDQNAETDQLPKCQDRPQYSFNSLLQIY